MVQVTGEGGSRVPLPSPARMPMDTYLIIVARDRPRLFQQLSERYGDAMKVIFDRRRTPRLTLGPPGYETPLVYDTRMDRNGFLFVPTTVVRRIEGRR